MATYPELEESTQDGAPVELLHFVMGALEWNYALADAAWVFSGDTYAHVPGLRRTEFAAGDADSDGAFDVLAPLDLDLVQLLLGGTPSTTIELTLYRLQREAPGDFVIHWKGEVMNAEAYVHEETAEATIHCEPLLARAVRMVPRHRVARTCTWEFGDPATCQKDPEVGALTAEVTALDEGGRVITVDGLAAAAGADTTMFVNGEIVAGAHHGFVSGQDGDDLVLLRPIPGLIVGATVTAKRGCDYTPSTCKTRHNNRPNFGGFTNMPTRNPAKGAGLALAAT